MKFFKNKFVIGIFCLILALVVVVMVMPKNTGKTVDVIKLNNTVDANTQITDNMVRKMQMFQVQLLKKKKLLANIQQHKFIKTTSLLMES